MTDNPPVTDDDRAYFLARARCDLTDAGPLSDSQIEAWRVALVRDLTDMRLRSTPVWLRVQTSITIQVLEAEIEQRDRLAKYGAPGYAPETYVTDALDVLRQRADLVALMAEQQVVFDPRRPGHGDSWALCPFHAERHASLHVDTTNNVWHCFGCGLGGDVFTWLQTHGQMTFWEAVQFLARRYGVSLERPPRGFTTYALTDGGDDHDG